MAKRRALISVSDKRELEGFARGLVAAGFELVSTGGTAKALAAAGLPVTKVADVTGAPEILGGRVKTLHPKIHGGILARLDLQADQADLASQGIEPLELVVVNLYPFREAVARGAAYATCVEEIDIGGPAMIRAAAKNAAFVGVVVDPADYPAVLAEVTSGRLSDPTRRHLQRKAFAHTAAYDAAIAEYLMGLGVEGEKAQPLPPAAFARTRTRPAASTGPSPGRASRRSRGRRCSAARSSPSTTSSTSTRRSPAPRSSTSRSRWW